MKVGIIQLEINDDESPKQRLQRVDALLENIMYVKRNQLMGNLLHTIQTWLKN